jgi:hypothetical protein
MQDKENRTFASSLHLSGRTIHEILESSMAGHTMIYLDHGTRLQ